jgi:hypothetical protein
MTGFLIEILWTVLITATMLLVDFISSQWIIDRRNATAIQQAIDQATTDTRKLKEIKAHLERRRVRQAAALNWGADLTAVALSMDLATLALWISSPQMFPFFSRFNTSSQSIEIPVWLILLLAHLVLLMLSTICKNLHGDTVESVEPSQIGNAFRNAWFVQNRWMLVGNLIGFLSLLSSFVVITNAI